MKKAGGKKPADPFRPGPWHEPRRFAGHTKANHGGSQAAGSPDTALCPDPSYSDSLPLICGSGAPSPGVSRPAFE